MRRTAKVIGGIVMGTAVVIGACVAAFFLTDRDGWNKRHFDRIVLGMTRAELLDLLGEKPDCVVRVGRSEAWFYRGALGPVPCQAQAETPAGLPTMYGTLQVLIGPDDRVRALAMDGERYLKVRSGDSPGGATLQGISPREVE